MLFPFFIIGFVLKRHEKILIRVSKFNLLYLFGIIVFALVLAGLNGSVNMAYTSYGKSMIPCYIVATILSVCSLALIKRYFNKENKFVKIISIGTLFILAFHKIAIIGLNEIYPINNMFINLLYSGIIIILFGGCIWILNRYCPLLIGKYKLKNK